MRAKLGLGVALTLVVTAGIATVGVVTAGAVASTAATGRSSVAATASDTSTTSSSTSTTSTVATTTTTTPTTTTPTTTTVPPTTPTTTPSSGAATVGAVARVPAATETSTPGETTTTVLGGPATGSAPADAASARPDGQIQLTEPPPIPTTTTTLPPDALPADSGTGRRAVYSKSRQRVWTVEADGSVSKTHLVSGRLTWNQPLPGTYSVFSRSSFTCNIKDPSICWRYMVRFTKGPEGDNIGFHEIPNRNGRPVQSVWQLGTALSGGCVRQATPDAQYMWGWAPIGTKVVVLP